MLCPSHTLLFYIFSVAELSPRFVLDFLAVVQDYSVLLISISFNFLYIFSLLLIDLIFMFIFSFYLFVYFSFPRFFSVPRRWAARWSGRVAGAAPAVGHAARVDVSLLLPPGAPHVPRLSIGRSPGIINIRATSDRFMSPFTLYTAATLGLRIKK